MDARQKKMNNAAIWNVGKNGSPTLKNDKKNTHNYRLKNFVVTVYCNDSERNVFDWLL